MENKLITVVGLGNTGRTIVSFLMQEKNFVFTINILDPSDEVEGSFLDLSHASILTNHKIILNDFDLFENSEFVFHTAGASVKKGQTRNSIVKESLELTKQIFGSVKFKSKPYIIVISNPVDVVCTYLHNDLEVGVKQVIGTGTLLDTARLHFYSKDNKGIILGEHGENMVFNDFINETLKQKTINSAKQIKQTQGSTFYGVAQCSIKILDVILNKNTKEIFPLSIHQENQSVFSSVEAKFNGVVFKPIQKQYSKSVELALKSSIKSIEKTYRG